MIGWVHPSIVPVSEGSSGIAPVCGSAWEASRLLQVHFGNPKCSGPHRLEA